MNRSNRRAFYRTTILLLLLAIAGTKAIAQNMYGTMKGVISISSVFNKSTVAASSKKLEITLDYEHATFEMRIPINTLYTGVEYLDNDFKEMEGKDFTLKGQLGVEYINTNQHSAQHFEFNAVLTQQGMESEVTGTGRLEHITGVGQYACLLGIQFELNPDALDLGIFGHNKMNIQVRQTVLNQLNKGY